LVAKRSGCKRSKDRRAKDVVILARMQVTVNHDKVGIVSLGDAASASVNVGHTMSPRGKGIDRLVAADSLLRLPR
jgi:hypothetical protein